MRRGFATVVALLALFGCSTPAKTLDTAATERAVAKAVTDRVDAPVTKAVCPAELRRGSGRIATCTVTVKGVDGVVRTRIRQVDGDGTLDVRLLDAVIANTRVTAELKAQLKARFARAFQADCGKGLRVVAPDDTFRCRARDATGRRTVVVTVTDTAGTLRFKILS